MATVLRITSKKKGFRRAGLTHPDTAVDHKVENLTVGQIKALKAEKTLVVHEVEVDGPKSVPKPDPKPAPKPTRARPAPPAPSAA